MWRGTASAVLLLVLCSTAQGTSARLLQQNAQPPQQAASAPQDMSSSQTASAPMSSHMADTPAPAAGAPAALQTADSPAQAANAPISSHMADTSAPAASATAALQTADSSAQAAGAPASSQMTDASASAPSMEGYQGSDIQTQANNRAGVNAFYQTNSQPSSFQNSGQQQAPTFGFGLRQQAPSTTDQAPPPVLSVSQANPNKISNYLVDLAPGSSIDLGNQNGYPRIAATAPGQSVVVAQGPGQKNPDVSFNLGPQETPVKVTLGRQQALDGGVSDNPQANDESGLSGSLNLGHYGVTQSNSFESVNVGGQGAQLVTPFAKLQVPYKALTNFGQSFQQLPGQLQNIAHVFQVQSNGVPMMAPQAAPLAPMGSYAGQQAP